MTVEPESPVPVATGGIGPPVWSEHFCEVEVRVIDGAHTSQQVQRLRLYLPEELQRGPAGLLCRACGHAEGAKGDGGGSYASFAGNANFACDQQVHLKR